jgi:hypothetical protein
MKSYTQRRNQFGDLTGNTTTANLARADILMNDCDRRLVNKFKLNEKQDTTQVTVAGQQSYFTPYNYTKMIDLYVTIGNQRITPVEVTDRATWDRMNQVTYQANYPQWYYLFNGKFELLPIPSTSSLVITQNYKCISKDLSQADYTTGTVSITNGATALVGVGTTWTASMVGRWVQIAPSSGDNEWYQIAAFVSTTALTLYKAYNGVTVAAGTYTIGEMSILDPKFQDMSLFYALQVYYTSKVKDPISSKLYGGLYKDLLDQLNAEASSKSASPVVDSGDDAEGVLINPNLTPMF